MIAQTRVWHEYPESDFLCRRAAKGIERLAGEAIAAKGAFSIVLAGGNTPQAVYRQLRHVRTDWSAWHVYFGDERCLPANRPELNSVMADQSWLEHVAIPAGQIHRIPAQLGADVAAIQYSAELEGVGDFDLVLLGLGQDGHTASLFPGKEWGRDSAQPAALAVHDAPKPPRDRVSLSAWRLSRAAAVWFLVTGRDKALAVQSWRNGACIPAASISPPGGVDIWLARAG